MKILWVKIGGLWPLNIGGRLRSYHLLSELSQRHQVTVLTTHGSGEDPDELARQLPHCEHVVSFPYSAPKAGSVRFAGALARSWLSPLPVDLFKCRVPALRAEVDRLLNSGAVDLCIADFLFAAPNVRFGSTPIVLFEHNVEFMIWKRLADIEKRLWRRALLQIEWRKVQRLERQACCQSRLVLAVSPLDRAALAETAPAARIQSIPTGVDTAYYSANGTPEEPRHLVFTGAMDWYPNEDAILYFVTEILPAIQREMPEVMFTVVGRNPSARLRSVAEPAGVRITGTVDDVRPFIDAAAVYVVPLRVGGGTRLKIFEALAMQKAVVSTTVGAEGLPLVDGEHFVRADHPGEFARAVVSLLQDSSRRKALGSAGGDLVRSKYSWTSVAREFEMKLEEALAQS